MTSTKLVSYFGVSFLLALACVHTAAAQDHAQGAMPAHAPAAAAADAAQAASQLPPTTGKVVETFDSGGYTYVQVDDNGRKLWAAGPTTKIAVGTKVMLPDGMPMANFTSKSLNRTFDMIYFVSSIQIVNDQASNAMAAAHSAAAHSASNAPAPAQVDFSNIKKADGGHTVAELYSGKTALAGKDVAVRGRVVKYTAAVMGKNWVHVRDGSGANGTNDLTVSTNATAAIGDMVLVRGKLQTDRDLGAGYRYEVIIEDAVLTVE
ncbi:MAG TPA: hypothetical protein VMT89_15880 [Candidatus Acidoferrales bacterium]|nr:hypothetical protein [Candidatus Acidoferrales bacterium]